jgi:DNA-binding NarL/FixJ family response regulator
MISIVLVTSHTLAAYYLRDLVIQLDIDTDPVIFPAHEICREKLPSETGVVVLIDLQDLPYLMSTYLDSFNSEQEGPAFLAIGPPRSVLDVATLLLTGFAGFICHSDVPTLLGPAIHSVAQGQTWMTSEVMRAYVTLTSRRTVTEMGTEVLTYRESQILELLRKRYSHREMAQFIVISESPIKFHFSNFLLKINVNRRRDFSKNVMTLNFHIV